ncbi:hypothetical protein A9Q96_16885 [Rhodobacterales bacterium 52_120_T64]|nr:hypothetical protein A9Q96_16885 [Rhodobacterales bacterium 52_120_T64]
MNSDTSNSVNKTDSPEIWAIHLLRTVVQERRLTKEFLASMEFSRARSALLDTSNQTDVENYWLALSYLGRAASVSKPAEKELKPIILDLISKGGPEFTALPDGEDRYYLAKALKFGSTEEIVVRAFKELVGEDVAEKARNVWLKIALDKSLSKEEFLKKVNAQLSDNADIEAMNADALARRMRRIGSTILEPLITSDIPSGTGYGIELKKFFTGPFGKQGPEDRDLRAAFSVEIVNSLHRIVRLNFSAGSDPAVYLIASDVKVWWVPASPPLQLEQAIRRLAKAGMEALHIFARQGVQNSPLRNALVQSTGADNIQNLARAITAEDSSLEENISHWLVTGRELEERRTTEAIDQLSSTRLDEYIGRLLVSSSGPEASSKSLTFAAERVEDLMPEEAAIVSMAAARLAQVNQWARAIARSRYVELVGERGDTISYDPAIHQGDDKLTIGSKVRVVTPGAFRSEPGRPKMLILKVEVSE